MSVLTFERLVRRPTGPMDGAALDVTVPVVDGVRLCDLVGGDRYPGVDVAEVAPPARWWLGAPPVLEGDEEEDDRVVLLDGWCSIPDCCGLLARIDVTDDHVRWHDLFARGEPDPPPGLTFTFDRSAYEAALAGVGAIEPRPWTLAEDGAEG